MAHNFSDDSDFELPPLKKKKQAAGSGKKQKEAGNKVAPRARVAIYWLPHDKLRPSFLLFLFLIILWSDSAVAPHFMLQLTNQVGYVIVIARLPGIYSNVN